VLLLTINENEQAVVGAGVAVSTHKTVAPFVILVDV
jgi:hypothetical protein